MNAPFVVTALEASRARTGFTSGEGSLDRYFIQHVTQDVRRRVAACYVAIDASSDCIAGYYTLAASAVALDAWPPEAVRRLPRYPSIPVVLIGRLAVDRSFQGRGLGAALHVDALLRSASADIAAFAAIVDAIDDRAAAFYRRHGFIPFSERQRRLFLPLASLPEIAKRSR